MEIHGATSGLHQLTSYTCHSLCCDKYLASRRQGSLHSTLTRCLSGQGVSSFYRAAGPFHPHLPPHNPKKSCHNLPQSDLQSLKWWAECNIKEFNSCLIKTMQSTGPQTLKDLLNNSIFISLSARHCGARWSLVLTFEVREVFPYCLFPHKHLLSAKPLPLSLLCQLPFSASIQYKVICSKLL